MNFKKFALRASLAGLATLIAVPALAQTYSGNNIYKVTRSNGSTAVVVANQTPGASLAVEFSGATSTRRVTANACGLVVLRDTSTNALADLVSVDGATINQATLPTQLLPRCVDGTLEEARTANFKTGAGEVVIVKAPNTVYDALYSGGRTRNVTVNACGYGLITSTDTYNLALPEFNGFSIGGTPYQVSTLPLANPEPLCRSGALYVPAAW